VKPERLAEIQRTLREAGVPEEVVSYATEDGLHMWLHTAAGLLILPVMLAGFVVGGFCLWPALENITAQNARHHAAEVGALLYHYNFGLSLVLALFAWIFASGAIAGLAPALSRRARKTLFVFSILDGKRAMVRLIADRLRDETDPARYVSKIVLGWVPMAAVAAVVLAAISGLAVARDIQSHLLFTSTGYIRSPFFPWGSARPHEWSSAVSVETGCNHVVSRSGISDDIIYQVKFADGSSVRIGDAIPLEGSWLTAAEAIDQELRASGATFSTWKWLGRDPRRRLCLAALQQRFPGQDFERVQRLLRITE
jgi:hypothetical protein